MHFLKFYISHRRFILQVGLLMKPHVKKQTIIAHTDCGGLKKIHFESMQKAIELNWIKRLKMSSNCAVLADLQMNLPIPLTEVG